MTKYILDKVLFLVEVETILVEGGCSYFKYLGSYWVETIPELGTSLGTVLYLSSLAILRMH